MHLFLVQVLKKHLGIYLDEKLNLNHHIKEKMTKAMKEIELLKD